MNCLKCNSGDVSTGQGEQKFKNACQSCGFVWDDDSVIGAMAKTLADIKAKQDAMESWLNFLVGKKPMVCPECNSNEIVSNGYGEHGRMHRCLSCSFAWNDGSEATWAINKSKDNSSIRLNSIEEKVNAINEIIGNALDNSSRITNYYLPKTTCPKCFETGRFYNVERRMFFCDYCDYEEKDTRSIAKMIVDLEICAIGVTQFQFDEIKKNIQERIESIEHYLFNQASSESSGNSSKPSAAPNETLSIVSHRIYNNQVFVRDSNGREHSMPCFDGVTSLTSSRIGIRRVTLSDFMVLEETVLRN